MRCGADPAATVSLLYADRQVVIGDLVIERDPNLLDLLRGARGSHDPSGGLDGSRRARRCCRAHVLTAEGLATSGRHVDGVWGMQASPASTRLCPTPHERVGPAWQQR